MKPDEVALPEVVQQNVPKVTHRCKRCAQDEKQKWLPCVPVIDTSISIMYNGKGNSKTGVSISIKTSTPRWENK